MERAKLPELACFSGLFGKDFGLPDKDEVGRSNRLGPIEVKSAERITCIPARDGRGGSGLQDNPVFTGGS